MSDRQGVEIDYRPQCRGVWLDRGELDKIIERSAAAEMQPQPAPAPQAPMPPKAALQRQAIRCSTKAMAMVTRIRDAESRFWKNCSTKHRRGVKKGPPFGSPFFRMPRLINQLRTD